MIAEALAGKRIAVTGATGFVGTALVERLLRSVPGCELVLIVRDGNIVKVVNGATHVARPDFDKSIEKSLKDYFARYHTVSFENFKVHDEEIIDHDKGSIVVQPTGARV